MSSIFFGVGQAVATRNDIANATPVLLGILQDLEISFDQALKELIGQNKFAYDIAPAQMKITGKAKVGSTSALLLGNLFFGFQQSTGQPTLASVYNEQATPDATHHVTPGKIVTTAAGSNFYRDLGVYYAANLQQLSRDAAGTAGTYTVDQGGQYSFPADNVPLLISYSYYDGTETGAAQKEMVLSNQLMGTGPTFEIHTSVRYVSNGGVVNLYNLKLNACRISKMGQPFKNVDYMMQDVEFQAFADKLGNVGVMNLSS